MQIQIRKGDKYRIFNDTLLDLICIGLVNPIHKEPYGKKGTRIYLDVSDPLVQFLSMYRIMYFKLHTINRYSVVITMEDGFIGFSNVKLWKGRTLDDALSFSILYFASAVKDIEFMIETKEGIYESLKDIICIKH